VLLDIVVWHAVVYRMLEVVEREPGCLNVMAVYQLWQTLDRPTSILQRSVVGPMLCIDGDWSVYSVACEYFYDVCWRHYPSSTFRCCHGPCI